MDLNQRISDFLAGDGFAVVGASRDRSKYGNRVLRHYLDAGRDAFPVHPREREIEGRRCYADLASIPEPVHGVSIVTPPEVSVTVVEEAARLGLTRVWLQPGAEDEHVLERARELGLDPIAGGPCVLVSLRVSP